MFLRNLYLGGSSIFNPLRSPDEGGAPEPEQTGGAEEAPIVAVEEAAVAEAARAKEITDAKAKEDADAEVAAAAEKTEGDDPAKPKDGWKDKELNKKHAQLQEAKRLAAERDQRIKDLEDLVARGAKPAGEGDAQALERPAARAAEPKADDPAVIAAAQTLRAQERFVEDCQNVEARGMDVYKDEFVKATQTISTLGGFDPETMAGLLATDDPAKVIFELGSKPEEFQRIMDLPHAKRISEMTKIAIATTAIPKAKVSEAPAPVEQVGGRGGSSTTELRDDLSDDEWNRLRDQQEAARWAKKNGRAA